MKQKLQVFLTGLLVASVAFNLSAKEISLEEAKYMAKNVYMMQASNNASFKAENVKLSESFTKADKHSNEVSCYIFNFEPAGFVILSAEDNYNAVLAFSDESNIDFNDDERNMGLWGNLSVHEQRIDHVRKNRIQAPASIENEWKKIKSTDHKNAKTSQSFDVVVAPLTTTKWDQGTYYNAHCPADPEASQDGRVWGGCVPIAMAQLIKFHNYPSGGNGSNSYTEANYGPLSAEFCGTSYNWSNMPDELTTYNDDVARLIYQMGVATNTEYSPIYTNTYWTYVRNTFVDYFNFDHSASIIADENNDLFSDIAKKDLDKGLPLILTGTDLASGWGHCWVADGYGYFDTSAGAGQEYFHFNWGWKGDNNGWFLDNGSLWEFREDQPESFDVIYYWKRTILYNVFPAQNECQVPAGYYTSALKETNTFLNYFNHNLDEQTQFRYRQLGTSAWTEFPVTPNYYQYVNSLTPDTEYEYQARRDCCGGVWSDYSDAKTFRTKREGESCNNISISAAPDFFTLAGFSTDSHNLFQYYYNADGYEFVYGFAEKCNQWAAVEYYDCNGNLLDVEVPRGSIITYLYENECPYIEPDCAKNSGTLFYDLCDNGEVYYFLRDDSGVVYDPYFPSGSNFAFVDGTQVNYDFTPRGNSACSVATGGAIQLTCVEYAGENGAIFQVYPWILDIVEPDNCNGETINLFDFGRYTFLTIVDNTGKENLYLYNGVFYCSDKTCVDFYISGVPVAESWTCGETSTVETPVTENPVETEEPVEPEEPMISDCPTLSSDLLSSPATTSSIYLYAAQPMGVIPNQFRYRVAGSTEWLLSDISDLYYKLIPDLVSGVRYEYQFRQQCSSGSWSAYTESHNFTIGGGLMTKGNQITPMSLNEVTKIAEGNLVDIQVYPNPATDVLFVSTTAGFENNMIRVYNIAGDLVKSVPVENTNASSKIEVADLTPGMYLIEINKGDEIAHEKFIKR